MTEFLVRAATGDDAAALARHRAEMFRDMGKLPDRSYGEMVEASRAYFAAAVASGEYVAWLAAPADDRQTIVAGAGMQLRRILPSIRQGVSGVEVTSRPQGYVMNVFVERAWRRRGLARLLMERVLDEAARRDVAHLALHASDDGRPLYESLGFRQTNEMRYAGPLALRALGTAEDADGARTA